MGEKWVSLRGSTPRGVVRIGNTVRRPLRADHTLPHALLQHLERVGFDGAPRLLGIDADGREALAYIDGQPARAAGSNDSIGDAAIAAGARLLRRFHDAAAGSAIAGRWETVCHNDWTPSNTLFVGERAVALVDFEAAAPGSRAWDIGFGAYHWLDLGYPAYAGAEQRRRLTLLVEAYGWPAIDPATAALHAVARICWFADRLSAQGESRNAEWAARCAQWTAREVAAPLVAEAP